MQRYTFILLLFFQVFASAQPEAVIPNAPIENIQPTVMVIPFVRADQNIRTVYEQEQHNPIRASISKIKNGLDQAGIKNIDFRAVLRQLANQEAMQPNQQSSVKQQVIELSAADIYIEAETQIIQTTRGNSVTVILTAYDAFTGQSLVNKLGHSPKFYTENYEKLAEKALDTFLKIFTSELKVSFLDMLQNGRTIAVDIGIAEHSTIDMDSDIGDSDQLLSDVLENWMEENALNAYFHIQGITATRMIIDQVKIPAKDSNNKNYRPSKFASKLRKFLVSQGFEVTRDIQGSKIFITISS